MVRSQSMLRMCVIKAWCGRAATEGVLYCRAGSGKCSDQRGPGHPQRTQNAAHLGRGAGGAVAGPERGQCICSHRRLCTCRGESSLHTVPFLVYQRHGGRRAGPVGMPTEVCRGLRGNSGTRMTHLPASKICRLPAAHVQGLQQDISLHSAGAKGCQCMGARPTSDRHAHGPGRLPRHRAHPASLQTTFLLWSRRPRSGPPVTLATLKRRYVPHESPRSHDTSLRQRACA